MDQLESISDFTLVFENALIHRNMWKCVSQGAEGKIFKGPNNRGITYIALFAEFEQ